MTNLVKEKFLENCKENNKIFSTGFMSLDSYLKDIEVGSIISIGGRPAIGKTEFALSLTNHFLSKDLKVLYFNLETANKNIINRLVSNKANIPIKDILNKQIELLQVIQDLDFYVDKIIKIISKTNLFVEDIETSIKDINPKIVIVDYIQLVKIQDVNSDLIQELKRIAIENNLILIVLSQISRRVEHRNDHRPMLADLKLFSSLEELSDVVLMLYRDKYYNLDDNALPYAEIIVRKNNFGSVGMINLDFRNGHFIEIEPLL